MQDRLCVSVSQFEITGLHRTALKHLCILVRKYLQDIEIPETLKDWVSVQWGQSDHMGRRCFFSLVWQPF